LLHQFLEPVLPLRQRQVAGQSRELAGSRGLLFQQFEQPLALPALFQKLFGASHPGAIQQLLDPGALQPVLLRQFGVLGFQGFTVLHRGGTVGIDFAKLAQVDSQDIDLKFQVAGRARQPRLRQGVLQKLVNLLRLRLQPIPLVLDFDRTGPEFREPLPFLFASLGGREEIIQGLEPGVSHRLIEQVLFLAPFLPGILELALELARHLFPLASCPGRFLGGGEHDDGQSGEYGRSPEIHPHLQAIEVGQVPDRGRDGGQYQE
jgi:hypothetical protein